ncbi:MAG TPA: 1,2-phenylacetyl-CoA epoxidase subunit PaaD [Actinomycetota bacterium]
MTPIAAADLRDRVRRALERVMDPEIPTASIVDLGMVERVQVRDDLVEVDLLPTFVGCPAKDVIGEDAEAAVREVSGDREVRMRFVFDPPWTTDRITEKGKAALREYGISPHWEGGPPDRGAVVVPLLAKPAGIPCPYCGSDRTVTESSFGPTPCRAAHFCRACRNAFEGFKVK